MNFFFWTLHEKNQQKKMRKFGLQPSFPQVFLAIEIAPLELACR